MQKLILIFLLSIFLVQSTDIINQIFQKLKKEQIKQDSTLIPFVQDQKYHGIYPSYVHLNFNGNWTQYFLRNEFSVFDNNAFVTAWITQILFEVNDMGLISLSKDVVVPSWSVLKKFKDENFEQDVPVFDFWLQKLNEQKVWTQWPVNMGFLIDAFDDIEGVLKWFLESVGLDWVWKDIEPLVELANDALASFDIPADFDDTSVTIAMAIHAKNKFPELYNEFISEYSNFTALRNQFLKNAYQPFSDDENVNSIDPRSYYWLRRFLLEKRDEAQKNGQIPDIKLVTTWVMNTATNIEFYPKGVKMPFNANNVDASVCANSLYGMTLSALNLPDEQKEQLFTPDMILLYSNTLDLVVWTLENDVLHDRPDLALLYYPPVYNFYWFVSRILFELRKVSASDNLFLKQALTKLEPTCLKFVTSQILDYSKSDEKGIYWDDFLGDGDEENGKKIIRGEDRIYSTSVAVNALLDVWSVKTVDCERNWIPTATPDIKQKIAAGISWIETYILKDTYRHENAFFSGSVKGLNQLPFLYPANRISFFNGTNIPPRGNNSVIVDDMLDMVQGVIEEADYQKMLTEIWFFAKTPQKFVTYNSPGHEFPYWSSPSLTYATSLLAISKQQSIVNCNK